MYGGWNQAKRELNAGKVIRENYQKSQLVEVVLEHYEEFMNATMDKWREYSRANNLPSVKPFLRHFRTWIESKEILASELKGLKD